MRPSIAVAAVVSAGRDAVASLCDGVARRRTDRPRADLGRRSTVDPQPVAQSHRNQRRLQTVLEGKAHPRARSVARHRAPATSAARTRSAPGGSSDTRKRHPVYDPSPGARQAPPQSGSIHVGCPPLACLATRQNDGTGRRPGATDRPRRMSAASAAGALSVGSAAAIGRLRRRTPPRCTWRAGREKPAPGRSAWSSGGRHDSPPPARRAEERRRRGPR